MVKWKVSIHRRFRKQYARLDPILRKRVEEAIKQLMESEDPERLGEYKRGRFLGCYAYDIGRRYRILYLVERETNTIWLLRVGTHKQVYEKD